MKARRRVVLPILLTTLCVPALCSATDEVVVTVQNELPLARDSETIALDAGDVARRLGTDDPRAIVVTESGQSLITQLVDLDDDGTPDQLLFQLDLEPRSTRRVSLKVGPARPLRAGDFRTYARFVRERHDDFAWENDRVAFRMYGKALESWQREPLTSSAVDAWCKRTRRLIVNDWYMVDDYHHDRGEGADLYSAGKTRGCGGNGLWVDGALSVSRNFVDSRVIAVGPIRAIFELVYEPWRVRGRRVAEVKRVTLDAGHNLNHFESRYLMLEPEEVLTAAGIKKAAGASVVAKPQAGWLRTWEALSGGNGHLGCAVVFDPESWVETTEDEMNHLVVLRTDAGSPVSYYAGSGWDKSGDFADAAAWEAYVDQYAQRLRSPVRIEIED